MRLDPSFDTANVTLGGQSAGEGHEHIAAASDSEEVEALASARETGQRPTGRNVGWLHSGGAWATENAGQAAGRTMSATETSTAAADGPGFCWSNFGPGLAERTGPDSGASAPQGTDKLSQRDREDRSVRMGSGQTGCQGQATGCDWDRPGVRFAHGDRPGSAATMRHSYSDASNSDDDEWWPNR